jgi:hypothetical protein
MKGEDTMASHAWQRLARALTALGLTASPACLPEVADPGAEPALEATRYLGELRSAFLVAAPAEDQHVTSVAPVIGDSIATGYERTGAELQVLGVRDPELALALPASADGARRLRKGGVAIAARLRAASPSPAEVAGGHVLYRDALGGGASVIAQVLADGLEDFLHFPARPPTERLVYDLELEEGVGGLRLVANTLEVLDPEGVPRLRVNPPFAVGADGAVVEVKLDVGRCAVDTDPAIPSAVRTPPGARSCEVGLSWTGLSYPALVDPAWVATTSMASQRIFPDSSLVIDGNHVLVSGGYDATGALTSAEIYKGSAGVWIATGSMTNKRYLHRQVLLGTGKVLVAGGLDYTSPYVASSEEYDPSSGTWIHQTSMAVGRYDFPLVLVQGRPVVLGGWSASGPLAASETYNPSTHAWSAFASMATPRAGAAAASYGANAFIVSGGYNYGAGYLDSSEVYSTATGAFWAGATMAGKRAYHLANIVTGNPKVLVTGGENSTGYLKTAETYYGSFNFPDPGSWSSILGMSVARMRHESVNLAPGRVMVCGGLQAAGAGNRSCEIFDSFTFGWSPTCDLTTERDSFTMHPVPSISESLAAGGFKTSAGYTRLASAELGGCNDRCTAGDAPLASGSSSCVSSICAADPFCCGAGGGYWDSICVREVRTICGSLGCSESDGACAHSLCMPGVPLASSCDSGRANCVSAICAVDPYCCSTAWDNVCIGRVNSTCGKGCN